MVLYYYLFHKIIKMGLDGTSMKKTWKSKVARATGNNHKIDKKILKLKASWDEVEGMLNSSVRKKKYR